MMFVHEGAARLGVDQGDIVNGETRQESNTADMIFSLARIVSILSEFMTLETGDIIATGTPSGVAHAMDLPGWMKAGNTVEV